LKTSDISIHVVDDDGSVRRSVARLLLSFGYRAQTWDTAEQFLAAKHPRGPACLILDLEMPGINGLELQKLLQESNRSMPIVFVSGKADVPDSVLAMKRGAVDFLTKPFDHQDLIAAIQRAAEKEEITRKARGEQKTIEHRVGTLTPRERQVLAQVIKGKLNKQIAYRLGISEKTVKVHRARVMDKMRAGSVAELVHLTEKIGTITKSETRTAVVLTA
jgi:FixJ family two-component response regulator